MSDTKAKPITKTEIRKQAKANEEKIRKLILKQTQECNPFKYNIKKEGKLTLQNKRVDGTKDMFDFGVDFVIKLPDGQMGVTGELIIRCDDLKKGDDIMKAPRFGSIDFDYNTFVEADYK